MRVRAPCGGCVRTCAAAGLAPACGRSSSGPPWGPLASPLAGAAAAPLGPTPWCPRALLGTLLPCCARSTDVVRCGAVWCGVPKALLPEGNGRDVYPRVQVNRRAVCLSALCVLVCCCTAGTSAQSHLADAALPTPVHGLTGSSGPTAPCVLPCTISTLCVRCAVVWCGAMVPILTTRATGHTTGDASTAPMAAVVEVPFQEHTVQPPESTFSVAT